MQMTGAAAALFLLILSGAAEAGEAVSATGKNLLTRGFIRFWNRFRRFHG